MMKKLIWLLPIALISFQSCGQNKSITKTTSLQEAEFAFNKYDYPKALRSYQAFWNNSDSEKIEDRVLAAQKLAYFAWHIERDIKTARDWTQKALHIGYNKSGSLKALSEFELEAANFQEAIRLAEESKATATTTLEKRLATQQWCQSLFMQAIQKIEVGEKYEKRLLKEALNKINNLAIDYPEDLYLAKLQIGIALLNKDFLNLFEAWKNYFRMGKSNPPPGLLSKASGLFRKVEQSGLTLTEMDPTLLKDVAQALIYSRFFDDASLLSKLFEGKLPSEFVALHNVIIYNKYLQDAEDLTYQFYRDLAKGKNKQQDFKDQLIFLKKACWNRLESSNKGNNFSGSSFSRVTKILFGAKHTQAIVNGYYAYYCWHEVSNELVSITQYDKKASLNVIEMDYLVSNDYSGWFHNLQRVGGTATKSTIVVVRPVMLQEPVQIWHFLTDPVLRKEMENQIARLQKLDLELVKKDQYAILPGMRLHILGKSTRSIYDSLKNAGLKNAELKMAFIQYYSDYMHHATLIHEARHSIDKRIGGFNANQMEYRAKLAEVALSRRPLFTFAAQVLRSESPNASHGMANSDLVRDMVKWMRKNSHQIEGFQKEVPAILQVDKLTNQQVKFVMQSLDPLAAN